MEKQKIKNPLARRIPRELIGDWRKYLVVSLFLILTIGFVSGMYVANGSMMSAASAGVSKYKLEDGHFELDQKADQKLIAAIQSGEKADVKQYYQEKARKELDETFQDEFQQKFTEQFDSEFQAEFDTAFEAQIRASLLAQGLDEFSADDMLPEAVAQAKQAGDYLAAYDTAYEESYQTAYDEAYETAYQEAWDDIQAEIDEAYKDAEEKYQLNDPDFQPVPVRVYENFYQNVSEDTNNDGTADGTVRVYAKTDEINLACLMEGRFPEQENEIAIDRMHADNADIQVGDTITVGKKAWSVTGLLAYVNYSTLHEKSTDFMFDALNFDVAMVTEAGFCSLDSSIHYAYAWQFEQTPVNEIEEKRLSDDFLKALLTQAVVNDSSLEDYLPRYANPAVNFATEDMGSDKAMGGVLLDILIVIIAFIFAVTISNTIAKEAQAIGTLRASGYTKGELIRHYLAMPVILTLAAAAIGNLMGYTIFKSVVVSMYYNSYSLPAYKTIWNPEAFIKTTLIPVALMFIVNLAVIVNLMQRTPLQFLRHDLKKSKRKKAIRLPHWKFFSRFRLRIMFQNMPNYIILFFGIFFISMMLAMAVGMPDTLNYYKSNAKNMMFAKYQYVLQNSKDEDGNIIRTEHKDAEPFHLYSLQRKSDALDEEISVYGISEHSQYVQIVDFQSLREDQIYISTSFRDKYGLGLGDVFFLDEKYENKQYRFEVAGYYDKCLSLAVFMPIKNFRNMFGLDADEFGGYLADTELTDIEESNIVAVITERDITKMCDQLDHSMGSYMKYFQALCILLSAVLIYLLTKLIIEKNETAISMTKILGYEDREIASLYLLSTTILLVIADAISVVLGSLAMEQAWKAILSGYSGWFPFVIQMAGYGKIFAFVLIGYLIVIGFDFKRIQNIPLDRALKSME